MYILSEYYLHYQKWPIQYAIFISSRLPRDSKWLERFNQAQLHDGTCMSLPTFHIIGRKDTVILPEESEELAHSFLNPILFYHEGGHYIPGTATLRQALTSFITKVMTSDSTKT